MSGCATICSGGALNQISPTSFAHPEEWQSLTHSLRYRLDAATLSGLFAERVRAGHAKICGMPAQSFDYFRKVFYEVFDKIYCAAYQSRLSEYMQRVVFVVGGNDPIVKTRHVLDAATQ